MIALFLSALKERWLNINFSVVVGLLWWGIFLLIFLIFSRKVCFSVICFWQWRKKWIVASTSNLKIKIGFKVFEHRLNDFFAGTSFCHYCPKDLTIHECFMVAPNIFSFLRWLFIQYFSELKYHWICFVDSMNMT